MLIIINGASGAGKTHLLENLYKLNKYKLTPIKKYTTRSTRSFENEEMSVDLVYDCEESMINNLEYHYKHNGNLYGINKVEIEDEIKKGNIPVIIIRSFKIIKKLQEDFLDTRVLFVVGATGETLKTQLNLQGRSENECLLLQCTHLDMIKDYSDNIDTIDGCIINCLYNEELFLKQFEHFIM